MIKAPTLAETLQEMESPIAREMLRQMPYLLNREAAERLADIAESYFHYRAARVHCEPLTISASSEARSATSCAELGRQGAPVDATAANPARTVY